MGISIFFSDDTAVKIMAKDEELLETLQSQQDPILHLYRWKNPSITYGHFIKIENMVQLEELNRQEIDISKRPTGGGIIFHLYDYAFSFLLPSGSKFFSANPIENYAFVHQIVKKALSKFLDQSHLNFLKASVEDRSDSSKFCMACPTIYDVMVQGKKIVGAAQRKKQQGYLHQGSIALMQPNFELVKKILKEPSLVASKMENFTYSFLSSDATHEELEQMRKKIQTELIVAFQTTFS